MTTQFPGQFSPEPRVSPSADDEPDSQNDGRRSRLSTRSRTRVKSRSKSVRFPNAPPLPTEPMPDFKDFAKLEADKEQAAMRNAARKDVAAPAAPQESALRDGVAAMLDQMAEGDTQLKLQLINKIIKKLEGSHAEQKELDYLIKYVAMLCGQFDEDERARILNEGIEDAVADTKAESPQPEPAMPEPTSPDAAVRNSLVSVFEDDTDSEADKEEKVSAAIAGLRNLKSRFARKRDDSDKIDDKDDKGDRTLSDRLFFRRRGDGVDEVTNDMADFNPYMPEDEDATGSKRSTLNRFLSLRRNGKDSKNKK